MAASISGRAAGEPGNTCYAGPHRGAHSVRVCAAAPTRGGRRLSGTGRSGVLKEGIARCSGRTRGPGSPASWGARLPFPADSSIELLMTAEKTDEIFSHGHSGPAPLSPTNLRVSSPSHGSSADTAYPAKAGNAVGHRGRVRQHTPTRTSRRDEAGIRALAVAPPGPAPKRQRSCLTSPRRPKAAARLCRKAETGGRGGDYLPRMPFSGPGAEPRCLSCLFGGGVLRRMGQIWSSPWCSSLSA